MFEIEELKEKGAKRAVLEYIVGQDSSIPVPRSVEMDEAGIGTVLRSDHWREFDDFYGIFETVFIGEKFDDGTPCLVPATVTDAAEALAYIWLKPSGNKGLDKWLKMRRDFFDAYCKAKGLDPHEVLSELKILPQETIKTKIKGTIFVHPNVPDRYIVYFNYMGSFIGIVADAHENEIAPVKTEINLWNIPIDQFFEKTSPISLADLYTLVNMYKRVSSFSKFQDSYSYMMEFSFNPLFVLQMRRFRKLEDGSGIICPWKDEAGVISTSLSLGVTPPEGLVLPYFHGSLVYGPQLDKKENHALHEFNAQHPNGFAYRSNDSDSHTHVFVPNLMAGFAGSFAHYFDHGALANIAAIPIYLFDTKDKIDRHPGEKEERFPSGAIVRVFSNGREGYVKIEKTK